MTAHLTGPALLLDAVDAARVDQQLRDAIRLAWLTRRLPPPRALLELADDIHRLANRFRANVQVATLPETGRANLPIPLRACDQHGLTVQQAAAVMGVSDQYARRLARRGDITASRQGQRGTWLIDSASALAWADRRHHHHQREREAA